VTTQIALAADLVPLVLNGKKTSTIRLGIRDYPLGHAKIVSGKLNIPIEITEIEFTKVGSLDGRVANSEGYGSLSELLLALRRFYPEAGNDRDVTVIRFRKL
jgi:hypothetical protein